MDKQVGVITEQGYFGQGFGFQESSEEEVEKFNRTNSEDDSQPYKKSRIN